MRIFPGGCRDTSLTFPLLVQLSTCYWKWQNLVFVSRCTQLKHLEYTALFTKHIVFQKKHALEDIYICFTSRKCQHILHTKCLLQVCSYFSKLREYKIKGCTLFSPQLPYVCVKDCSRTKKILLWKKRWKYVKTKTKNAKKHRKNGASTASHSLKYRSYTVVNNHLTKPYQKDPKSIYQS